MSSFEDSDADEEVMQRYAAARRREASRDMATHTDVAASDISWAVLGEVTATGGITSGLRFWQRPESLEHLVVGTNDTVVTGVKPWPACVGLASLIEKRSREVPGNFAGVRALELGAGLGVAGILLAKLGATVTLSDNAPEVLTLLRRNIVENCVARATTVVHLAWEQPEALDMDAESLDLIVGSDLVYGGPKNGELLLSAIGTLISLYGHPGTTVLLAFGCRCRGTDEHVAFLREATCRYEITQLEPDDAVAEESGVDGVDIVELRQGVGWRPL